MAINFRNLDYEIPADNLSLDNLINIIIGKARIRGRRLSFGRDSKGYFITNEWHQALLENIDFKNKRVLGITDSADFMLSAVNKGAREFIGIDLSLPVCLFAELKTIGVKNLSYEQFMDFFNLDEPDGSGSFSRLTYETKMRSDLSPVAKAFFDKVIGRTYTPSFSEKNKVTIPLAFSFFTIPVSSYSLQHEILHLSSPMHFYETKINLANADITLLQGDLLGKVASKDSVTGKFDIIYSSNVHQYCDLKPGDFMNALHPRLNRGGKIIFFPEPREKDSVLQDLHASGFETTEYNQADLISGLIPALFPTGYAAWKKTK